jgi:hypothetical protein
LWYDAVYVDRRISHTCLESVPIALQNATAPPKYAELLTEMDEAGYDSDDGGNHAQRLTADPKYQLMLAPPRHERHTRRRRDQAFNMPLQPMARSRPRNAGY